MLPHNVDDSSSDQGVLDDERIKVGSRISNDGTHNWVPSTHSRIINVSNQGSWVQVVKRFKDLSSSIIWKTHDQSINFGSKGTLTCEICNRCQGKRRRRHMHKRRNDNLKR